MLSWPGLPVGLILTHRISTPRTPKEINPWISAHYGDQSSIPSGTRAPSSASYNTVRNTRVGFSGISHDREGTGRAYPSPTPLARQNCEGTRREALRLTFPCLSGNLSFYPGFLPCRVAILTAIRKALVGSLVGGSPFIVYHSHSLLFVLLKRPIEKEITGVFFFFFFFFFLSHVFVVKVQETAWSASYGVNKTITNPTTRFTPSWEKSNPSNPEPILPPRST